MATTSRPHGLVDDDALVESVEQLNEAGENLMLGGVTAERIAEEHPWSRSVIRRHLNQLVNAGRLETQYGFGETPKKTYLPPEADENGGDWR